MPVSQTPAVLALMALVWLVSLAAAFQLIRAALTGRGSRPSTKVSKAVDELRFRLRLAAGLGLLVWVASGLVWLAFHWN